MREIADAMIAEIARQVPGTIARIGISRPTSDPMMLPLAWKDARVALDVARQTGKNRVVAFGDAGVAGLLMSMREGADFKAFVAEKLGELLNEKSLQRDMLMKTLHAYFASNCSQKTAAIELRIHQKTMAYRLEKIQRLTGLDLAYHEHRVLVYLAMRMNDLIA
jgi:sugar diacid utilization regulator